MYESNDKMVSHPAHYQASNGMEVIDVIKAFTADLTGIEAVDTGNIIKYICRWKKKNGLQDLEKALWYLQDLIENVKNVKNVERQQDIENFLGAISNGTINARPVTPDEIKVMEAIIHGNS